LNTVDYYDRQELVLRVHPDERAKLVVQIGASDGDNALEAALKVQNDCQAIDLNCGCPKRFSTHDGSGANLLETPDLLISILDKLVKGLSIPVTCKIRLVVEKDGRSTLQRTCELLKRIENTGVKAIGIHCRFHYEKPREPGHWEYFNQLAESVSIPVIANGDLFTMDDIDRLRADKGSSCSSFMIARGAMWNPSVFRKEGPLPIRQIMIEYLKLAIENDANYNNLKYTLLQMKTDDSYGGMYECKTTEELCIFFDIHQFYLDSMEALDKRKLELDPENEILMASRSAKRLKHRHPAKTNILGLQV
jgi:tRNA-dihydrouridine synthase 2